MDGNSLYTGVNVQWSSGVVPPVYDYLLGHIDDAEQVVFVPTFYQLLHLICVNRLIGVMSYESY